MLLGVSGGVAVYKAAELSRLLIGEGAEVRVAMTAAAVEFVTPLTFEALTGNPVAVDMFGPRDEPATVHVELGRWAEVLVVAPATADMIARLALGLADDLLSTAALAISRRSSVFSLRAYMVTVRSESSSPHCTPGVQFPACTWIV